LKLDAHKAACDFAFAAVAEFEGLPEGHAAGARARAVVTSSTPPGLRARACDCARRSADMAVAANAPANEHAALQGLVTGQGCNVGGGSLKIAERRDPARGFDAGTAETRAVAAASAPEGKLVELARGRALDLGRCTDKHLSPEGRVKDVEKLTSCACGVVKRWALPVKKSDPRITARLPLAGDVVLPITVEGGQVVDCGPARGP
jgi:hypothetical protein